MKDNSGLPIGTMARKWKSTLRRDADALVATLARCATAADLGTLQDCVLEALEAAWDYRSSTFFSAELRPERISLDVGAIRGFDPDSLTTYLGHFAPSDVFVGDRARALLQRRGIVGYEELESSLAAHEERYVAGFMEPFGIRSQLTARVDTGLPVQGVLSIMSSHRDAFGERDREILSAMGAVTAAQLRTVLLEANAPLQRTSLSLREREVAALAADGYDNASIGRRLRIGIDTVKKHLGAAYSKLGVANRTQLALRWREETSRAQHT